MSSWCLFLPSAHITVLFFYVSSLRVSAGLHLRWSIGWARRSTTLNLFATGHTRWVLIHIRPGVFLGADCVWSCCWTVRLYSHHIRHCSHNASAPVHLDWGSVFRLRRWGLQGMLEIKRSGPAAKKLNHHQHCGGQSPSTPNLDNLCYNGLGWLLRCCRQGVSSWEMCPCPHNVCTVFFTTRHIGLATMQESVGERSVAVTVSNYLMSHSHVRKRWTLSYWTFLSFLSMADAEVLIHTFVSSRLYCCNVLLSGLSRAALKVFKRFSMLQLES